MSKYDIKEPDLMAREIKKEAFLARHLNGTKLSYWLNELLGSSARNVYQVRYFGEHNFDDLVSQPIAQKP